MIYTHRTINLISWACIKHLTKRSFVCLHFITCSLPLIKRVEITGFYLKILSGTGKVNHKHILVMVIKPSNTRENLIITN